ncbi:MAG: hypothetical protein ACI837_000703 [Crocinitomicaceae bacterium]|jgi:hypothetical protein
MMKKHYTSLLCLLVICFSSSLAISQCNFVVTTADSTLCLGDSTILTSGGAADSLITTLAAGNNHRGNMFDINALNSVTITSFDAHPQANTTIEIYYKIGSHVGFENTPLAWTLIGSAPVIALPIGTATPVPVPINITIPAGQVYAFYVTSTNVAVSLNYTDGFVVGNVWNQDANIQFLEGAGMEYPFTNGTGSFFSPRVWNGYIHYEMPLDYLWSTGDTTQSINVGPVVDTDYWVTVTDVLNACNNTDSILVTVSTPPTVNLGADTTYCAPGSLALDAGNPGLTYLWNTAEGTQLINTTTSGLYYVDVTDASGCRGTDSIDVTVNSHTVNLGIDTTICTGTTLTLDAGAGLSYLWSTSAISQTIDVTTAGTYFVDAIGANSCLGTDTLNLTVQASPVVDLGADTTICNGDSITLDAGGPGFTYLWNTTEITQTITTNTSSTYSVTVQDPLGCAGSDDIIISTADTPIASFTATPTLLDVSFVDGSTDAVTYSWDFGDTGTSTLASPSHTYTADGTYTVVLIVNGPCGSDTTQMDITVSAVGISEMLLDPSILLYPNPTNGQISIDVKSIDEGITLNILSLKGKLLTTEYFLKSTVIETKMDQAAGVYLLEMTTDSGKTKRFKVIKN